MKQTRPPLVGMKSQDYCHRICDGYFEVCSFIVIASGFSWAVFSAPALLLFLPYSVFRFFKKVYSIKYDAPWLQNCLLPTTKSGLQILSFQNESPYSDPPAISLTIKTNQVWGSFLRIKIGRFCSHILALSCDCRQRNNYFLKEILKEPKFLSFLKSLFIWMHVGNTLYWWVI